MPPKKQVKATPKKQVKATPKKETKATPVLLPAADLDQFAQKTETDKHSGKHDYLRAYEWILHPFRNTAFTFLELGVGHVAREASSLRTWKKYFPKANIIGVDNNENVARFEEARVKIEIGDASRPYFLRNLVRTHNPLVIVDDASHRWSHQITALRTMFPLLQPGGVMIVEDIQTSFISDKSKGFADADESFCDVLARLQTIIASGCSGKVPGHPWEYEVAAWTDIVVLAHKTVIFVKRKEPLEHALKTARRIKRQTRAANAKSG